jgi:hypothetical protein
VWVHHEVEVSLAIAHLRVCEGIESLAILLLNDREWAYRL